MASSCTHLAIALFLAILNYASVSHVLAAREFVEIAMIDRHEKWMAQHGRVYKDAAETARRFEIFKSNVAFIESFNAGNSTFWLAANQFTDLTDDEFKATRLGFKPSRANKVRTATVFRYENSSHNHLPKSIDWRKKGAVTPVKNQGECGCCWAFSSVAAIEGIVKLRIGRLISLSEQELVDCDIQADQGCEGGLMDTAFTFIRSNGGLTTEAKYPYQAADGICNFTAAAKSAVSISGYEDVPPNNEAALLKAVAHQPVSVAVAGGDNHFRFYAGGVLSGTCGTDLDHAITAVGYGTASDGTKYWLMKNSWGTSWGEKGYVRMERDIEHKEGLCGLAMDPSYPTA